MTSPQPGGWPERFPATVRVLPRTDLHAGAPTQGYYQHPPAPSGGDTHVVELPKAMRSDRCTGTNIDPEELRQSQRVELATVAIPSRRPTRGSVTVAESGDPAQLVVRVSPREGSDSGVRLAEGFTVDWLPREDAASINPATRNGNANAARHRVPILRFKPPRQLGEEPPGGYAGAAVDIELGASRVCPIGIQLGDLVAPR